MDIIYLHGLKVDCIIGVWEWESAVFGSPSPLISIWALILAAAGESDALEDTLSYKDVSKRVEAFVRESEFALVEKAGGADFPDTVDRV